MLCNFIHNKQTTEQLKIKKLNLINYKLFIILLFLHFDIKIKLKYKNIIKENNKIFFYEKAKKIYFDKYSIFLRKKVNIKNFLFKVKHKSKTKSKIENSRWKLFKKKYKFLYRRKNKKAIIYNLNVNKKRLYLTSKTKKSLKNKNPVKFYKTKKKIQKFEFNNYIKKWTKNNNKTYFYLIDKTSRVLYKKLKKLKTLLKYIFLYKMKKRANKLVKKIVDIKSIHKIRVVRPFSFKYTKNKNNIRFKFYNKNSLIFKLKKPNKAKQNEIKLNEFKNFPINIKTKTKTLNVIPKFTKQIKLKTYPTKLILKKQIFDTCFNTVEEFSYNLNKNPFVFFSLTSQLPLNIFNALDKFKNNKNNNLTIKNALDLTFKIKQKKSVGIFINNMFLKNNKQNVITNYTPLYYFNTNGIANMDLNLSRLKIKLYHNNINLSSSAKYKTFYIFFALMFLEQYLLKKIWIRINSNDPLNIFWKTHINIFLYNNMFLYKKFNKFIPIRELLEILLISFKNHDLQILLIFLKRKLESSHFKKHKKILSIFFDILRKNEFIFELLQIRGFFFDIRGKVGVSGNAKKRHHAFFIGKISTTSQNIGSYFQQISVWTPTGQMGITCTIQY